MTQFTSLYGKEAGLGLQILIYLRPKTNSNPIDLKAKHSVNFANPSVINLPRHFIILHLLKDAGLPVLYVPIGSTVFVLHNTLSYKLIQLYCYICFETFVPAQIISPILCSVLDLLS